MANIHSSYPSSDPALIVDGFLSGMPRIFSAQTTFLTSDVSSTGFFKAYGAGTRVGLDVGMRLGDILVHTQTTGTAKPGFVSMHSVIATSANQASTTSSTGYSNVGYDVTVSACT